MTLQRWKLSVLNNRVVSVLVVVSALVLSGLFTFVEVYNQVSDRDALNALSKFILTYPLVPTYILIVLVVTAIVQGFIDEAKRDFEASNKALRRELSATQQQVENFLLKINGLNERYDSVSRLAFFSVLFSKLRQEVTHVVAMWKGVENEIRKSAEGWQGNGAARSRENWSLQLQTLQADINRDLEMQVQLLAHPRFTANPAKSKCPDEPEGPEEVVFEYRKYHEQKEHALAGLEQAIERCSGRIETLRTRLGLT